MVDGLIELHLANFKASGAELVMGEARFTEPKTVQVTLNAGGTRRCGASASSCRRLARHHPGRAGLADAGPMTHVEALNLERLPEHLIILGGGYVGLEFAQAMRRFGSRVTIIQRGPQLLEREDPDVADALSELMQDEGIEVMLQAELLSVAGRSGTGVKLKVRTGTTEKTLEASDILVAVWPNAKHRSAGRGRAGVDLDSRGYIRVDEKLQTSAADVWAMGDCAGSPQFTHVGYDDFRVVLDNLAGGNRTRAAVSFPIACSPIRSWPTSV